MSKDFIAKDRQGRILYGQTCYWVNFLLIIRQCIREIWFLHLLKGKQKPEWCKLQSLRYPGFNLQRKWLLMGIIIAFKLESKIPYNK